MTIVFDIKIKIVVPKFKYTGQNILYAIYKSNVIYQCMDVYGIMVMTYRMTYTV